MQVARRGARSSERGAASSFSLCGKVQCRTATPWPKFPWSGAKSASGAAGGVKILWVTLQYDRSLGSTINRPHLILERNGNGIYPPRVAGFCVAEPPRWRLWDGEIQRTAISAQAIVRSASGDAELAAFRNQLPFRDQLAKSAMPLFR